MGHHAGLTDSEAGTPSGVGLPGGLFADLDPRFRLGAALVGSVTVVALQTLPALVTGTVLAVLTLLASRPKPGAVIPRLLAVEGFMAMIIVMLPFTMPATGPGDVLFAWGPLTATASGLEKAVAIVLKTNTVVLLLTALVGGMEPNSFARSLAAFGLPGRLITLMLITVRYLDVLQRDYQRLRRSMRIRGFRARANLHSLKSIGYLVGMLLVRSFDRAERILAAMRCRGFTGEFRFDTLPPPGWGDVALSAGTLVAITVCIAVEFSL